MERINKEGEIATAKTLARMLSAIPQCYGKGPARIITYDIHALQEMFYFSDNVIIVHESATSNWGWHPFDYFNTAIVFPDEGASKRFRNHFPKDIHTILCDKVRNGDKRVVTIKEGNPSGKHALIIDDLVMSGGTLIECGKALLAAGAKSVSVLVTHGIFTKDNFSDFSIFNKVWVTESCPDKLESIKAFPNFEVFSLGRSISNAIFQFSE